MKKRKFYTLTWNLENMFHPKSGGPRNDFTPTEGWTLELYQKKLTRIAIVIKKIIKDSGDLPFIIGFTEIENEVVLKDLLKLLPKRYKFTRENSFKHKYYDAAIFYDSNFFKLKKSVYHQVFEKHERGDVLQADFKINDEKITIFCCHLKARPSNKYYTSMYREAVCDNIQTLIWKIHGGDKLVRKTRTNKNYSSNNKKLNLDKNVIIMGDFNDEPFSKSIIDYLLASYDKNFVINQNNIYKVYLYNCSWEKLRSQKPGSLYYADSNHSNWSMLDQIIVSPSLLNMDSKIRYTSNSFKIIQNLTCDNSGIPLRTNKWDEETNEIIWQEGYSDHFPVSCNFIINT